MMKNAMLAVFAVGLGTLLLSNSASSATHADSIVQAKTCKYGSYIDENGKRQCRKYPRGSY